MNCIQLDNTLPNVFLQRADIQSDIWRRQACLEKGKTYLIEASSGTGKSSLCSFIIGYRKDFDGKILFDGKDSGKFKTADWVKLRQYHISLLFQELRLFIACPLDEFWSTTESRHDSCSCAAFRLPFGRRTHLASRRNELTNHGRHHDGRGTSAGSSSHHNQYWQAHATALRPCVEALTMIN